MGEPVCLLTVLQLLRDAHPINRQTWWPTRLMAVTILIFFGLAAFANSEAWSQPPVSAFYDWTDLSPAIAPGTLLRARQIQLPFYYKAKAWRILYMTRDYADRPILSSGVIVLSGYAPTDQRHRKIVAWAHPVTGVARNCAPSLRQSPVESMAGFNELIPHRYIISTTD